MSTVPDPYRVNLEFYRKQAKSLLKSARAGDAESIARLRRNVPRLSGAAPLNVALNDAQLAIARENGFASWPKFQASFADMDKRPRKFRPHVREFKWYEERVPGVMSMLKSGLPETLETIRQSHPKFSSASDDEVRAATFTEDDARLVLAREHGFATWDEFKSHVQAIESGQREEPFTAAFEAIKAGDEADLFALIQKHPDLLDAQGTNGSSLLNLAVSLKKPSICRQLIDSGADVDLATTRGLTPLHEAAYSNQPQLIEMLIAAGASVESFAFGDGGTPLLFALFWGHDAAREALVRYAIAPNNLRVSAGVGRIDLAERCFDQRGNLTADAMAHRAFYRPHTGFPEWKPSDNRQEILDEALVYCAKNGHVHMLDWLVQKGADVNGDPYRGTPLVWAIHSHRQDLHVSRMEVIRWLLGHGADVNCRGTFGGPTHGQGYTALHAAAEKGSLDIAKLLIERGADRSIKDDLYNGTPLKWAAHHKQDEVKQFLESV